MSSRATSTVPVKSENRIDEIMLIYKLKTAPGIRDSSREQYETRLIELEKICAPANIESIFMSPDWTLEQLRASKRRKKPASLSNSISTVISIMKHCLTEGEIPDSIRKRWSEIYKEVKAPVNDETISGKIKTNIKWIDVWAKNKTLYDKATSETATRTDLEDALISSMYVDLEPRRQEDYARLYIKTTPAPSPETSFIDMTLKEPKIYVTMYKTSDSLKEWSKKLPERLVTLLSLSLKIHPRDYMFVDSKGLPYKEVKPWSRRHNTKLCNWFGKGSTNVGLRHARSSAISVEGEEY